MQTVSRLNRAHPNKHDVFVLDFINDTETIRAAFDRYFRTMVLSDETDPNKLHDLVAAIDAHQVYDQAQVAELVELYLGGADRDRLDPILGQAGESGLRHRPSELCDERLLHQPGVGPDRALHQPR